MRHVVASTCSSGPVYASLAMIRSSRLRVSRSRLHVHNHLRLLRRPHSSQHLDQHTKQRLARLGEQRVQVGGADAQAEVGGVLKALEHAVILPAERGAKTRRTANGFTRTTAAPALPR